MSNRHTAKVDTTVSPAPETSMPVEAPAPVTPTPEAPEAQVITDVAQAQREYKKVLKDASMVIMISTMLHSIATGNMLPANVKVIVVDISQPTVTKLMDRGTWQALGIVSDVGAFLPMVAQQIKKRSK